jgi:outer membrane lipoprotein SlyB
MKNKETFMLKQFSFAVTAFALSVLAIVVNPALAETAAPNTSGTVEAIEIFRTADNQPVNVGTVLGGLAGGVIGHQIGSGRGNTAATVIGAIGGAAAGTELEKKRVQGSRYRITVRLDSGSVLIVEDTRDVNLRVGDRVRVENDRVFRL